MFGYFIGKIFRVEKEEEIEIPELVGKKYEDMVEKYGPQGYEIIQKAADYSADYEEGAITAQNPIAGTKTTDKKIYVEVSKGTKLVMVENVEGKDIKVAKYTLENTLGFIVEEEKEVSETVAEGIVISQEYKEVERPYGSIIKVKVSSGDGKERVFVPNVVGKNVSEAKSTLESMKLKVEIAYDEDANKSNGTVLAQSYPQNKELKEGDLITITVNRRVVNKTITVTGIPEETEQKDIAVKVSVDGGVYNNTTFNYDEENNTLTFTIDGYEKVSYTVTVNGSTIKSGSENL